MKCFPSAIRRVPCLALALLTAANAAGAVEIEVLATTAMKSSLDALAPQFTGASGHTPRIAYGPSGALARRVADGEAGDIVILTGGIDGPTPYSFARIPANFSLTVRTSSGLALATGGKSFSRS